LRNGTELMKALIELDTRLAFHPTIKKGDRDLLNEVINYLSHLRAINLLNIMEGEEKSD